MCFQRPNTYTHRYIHAHSYTYILQACRPTMQYYSPVLWSLIIPIPRETIGIHINYYLRILSQSNLGPGLPINIRIELQGFSSVHTWSDSIMLKYILIICVYWKSHNFGVDKNFRSLTTDSKSAPDSESDSVQKLRDIYWNQWEIQWASWIAICYFNQGTLFSVWRNVFAL